MKDLTPFLKLREAIRTEPPPWFLFGSQKSPELLGPVDQYTFVCCKKNILELFFSFLLRSYLHDSEWSELSNTQKDQSVLKLLSNMLEMTIRLTDFEQWEINLLLVNIFAMSTDFNQFCFLVFLRGPSEIRT